MEKRIKSLYIITILAILAFLGMQVYWLYGRYEYALTEYERSLYERITECVEDYAEIRNSSSNSIVDSINKNDAEKIMSVPTFSLRHEYGDSIKTTRTSKIYTYVFSAHKLLGIEPGTPLSDSQKDQAIELAQMQMKEPVDSMSFDASGAKDENEAWIATKNVQIERKSPFTVQGIDSVLMNAGIKATISLAKADTTVWRNKVEDHSPVFNPELSVTIPYSQLEGRTATIRIAINPFKILPGIWQILTISILVSSLLIICLILQFSTVLKLSRLDKMRNSFITTMIHELKRPLSTLKMCVSALYNERMMEDKITKKEILSETRNALDNLSAYFSKLRDITFNNVEQIPLNLRSVNLHELFDNVISATAFPADKAVKIKNGIDRGVVVSADRTHLYNILNNLFENAVKYSGASVEINATADEKNGCVELHVSDTGNGIPSSDMKHIFKRFYRGKASAGKQPGMGLGLAYAKLLIDAHGGDISVESTEGEGSCFTIILPQ